jgi:5-methylthioadenosine/S-adenosylhomocysteine deaminase
MTEATTQTGADPTGRRITVLSGATLITMDPQRRVLTDAAIAFDGRILAIGSTDEVVRAFPGADIRDAAEAVVMPGMVNTHTHLFQTLLKGLGDDRVLSDWMTHMTGPSGAQLTAEDAFAAAQHGCAEALTTGTTTILDFCYAHPRPGIGDAVAEAMDQVGIRGIVARGYLTTGDDVGLPAALVEPLDQALGDAARLMARWNRPGSRVTVGLAPCMSWSVDEATLVETRALADERSALITMHLAETPWDVSESERRFGMRDIPFAGKTGLLGPDLVGVHCVQVDDGDMKLLAETDTKVSHNPCSNLYLASGFAPVPEMQRRGITVGLASDGPASSSNHSMLQAVRIAALMHKGYHRDPEIITAERVLEMATIDGARCVGMEQEIGSLELGKRADIVVLDMNNLCVTPMHSAVSSIVYSQRGDEVREVYVDGQRVVEDGHLATVAEDTVRAQSFAAATSLARRAGTERFARRPWRTPADGSPDAK